MEKIKNFPKENIELLKKILDDLQKKIGRYRKITYSDIINHITREKLYEDKYNKLILWCNYKIRIGEIFYKH